MRNLLKLLTICLLFMASCQNNNTKTIKTYWYNDSTKLMERFEVQLHNDSIKHGLYESFYANGNKEYTKHYLQNQLNDTLFHYSENGVLIEKAFYKNNLLEGERILYFVNHQPQTIEIYKNNLLQGHSVIYYENGNKQEEGNFINNQREGEWKYYYKSGNLKEIVFYKSGSENGYYKSFYENGIKKSNGFYKDELEDSIWLNYYPSGRLNEIVHYKNGKEDGITQVFSEDSVLLKIIHYKVGIPIEFTDVKTGKTTKHNFGFLK